MVANEKLLMIAVDAAKAQEDFAQAWIRTCKARDAAIEHIESFAKASGFVVQRNSKQIIITVTPLEVPS